MMKVVMAMICVLVLLVAVLTRSTLGGFVIGGLVIAGGACLYMPGRKTSARGGSSIETFSEGTQAEGVPSVIFISGLGDSHESWTYTAEASEAAKKQWERVPPNTGIQDPISSYTRTMSIDWPGSGESPAWGVDEQPGTLEAEAEMVLHLAEKAGLRPPYVVVAHSFGCHVALALRGNHRSIVKGLILIDPPPYSAYSTPPKGMDTATGARIAAGAKSVANFDRAEIRAADDIVVHVDVVPEDAPERHVTRNRAALKEYETMFKTVIKHHGASHHVHLREPQEIIQSTLTLLRDGR